MWDYTSGRQRVDTQGVVLSEESQSPFFYYYIYQSKGWRPEH